MGNYFTQECNTLDKNNINICLVGNIKLRNIFLDHLFNENDTIKNHESKDINDYRIINFKLDNDKTLIIHLYIAPLYYTSFRQNYNENIIKSYSNNCSIIYFLHEDNVNYSENLIQNIQKLNYNCKFISLKYVPNNFRLLYNDSLIDYYYEIDIKNNNFLTKLLSFTIKTLIL